MPASRRLSRPPFIPSLEPYVRCPNRRCGLRARATGDLLVLTCENKHCRAHWWATRLEAGDIRSQIRAAFDGNEHFVEVMDAFGLPERIDRPMYWQIWLSGGDKFAMSDESKIGSLLVRTHAMMKRLVGLHRAAL